MSFSLKSKEESNSSTNAKPRIEWQTPGIFDNVKITEIKQGKSSIKGSPYIQMMTIGVNGEIGNSSKMYLSTTPSEGKTRSAWDVTAGNLVDLIIATKNISRTEAEAISLVPDNEPSVEKQHEMLVHKLSTLLVGHPFRAKFKGEQSKEGGIVYATLDRVETMNIPKEASRLRFDSKYDIKMFNQEVEQAAQKVDGLPF